ncbi:Ig-like domain-containing protein [Fodinibius salinus]|uniref:Ig-like domain-containing protein n=1 Tax=Fodinibius salinus TaxID=860790 RepID=A0A5D3YEY5_9BACT|nr:Ig-like domain-containing protein [Fodinibius salinus]
MTILSAFFITANSFAQTNFEDGFEDEDFTNNPTWSGEDSEFTVVDDSPNFLLQLNASTSPAYLTTPSTDVNGTWTFYIEFRGFEPSGSNQAEIFLMSDIADLEGAVNGYAVQVGESGNDFFKIVRYDSGSEAATVLTGTTVVQSGGTYTVRVNRDGSGNWQMEVSDNYGGPYNTNISGTDNTHTNASYLGPRINFTSTRSDKFYMDFKIDLPPFDVTQASVSGSQVDVTFNRGYNQSTVDASDFSIDNGIGTPSTSSVTFPNTTTVRLDYGSTNFPSDEYTVTVNDVDDQNGNTIAANTTTSFVIFGAFAQGDVIINEFRYDPPTGRQEYIELKNTSSKFLNLQNWELGDDGGTSTISYSNLTLRPDSFLVVSADTSSLFNEFGNRAYVSMGGLAGFNNGGDVVQINTSSGTQADSLRYTDEWGGENIALERRSDTAPATMQANWGDSPSSLGGTPGLTNEIPSDNTPPFFTDLFAVDETTLRLGFSEPITASSATNSSNYQITPNRKIQLVSAQDDSVTLVLSSPLTDGESYDVTASNISDIFGNTLSGATRSFDFLKIDEALSRDIVINEVLYNPDDQGTADFVELYNTTDKNFDLSNWTISDASSTSSIPANTQLKANEYLVVTGDAVFANSVPNAIQLSGFPAFNNSSGDIVQLKNSNGESIDSLRYATTWGGSQEGTSMERIDPSAASNDASNWQTSTANNGFSAGVENPSLQPDTTPPEAVFSKTLPGGNIKVQFNEFIQLTQSLSFQSGGQKLQVAEYDSVNANSIILDGGQSKSTGAAAKVTIQNLTDFVGNTTNSTEIPIAQSISANQKNIVINEIMYNPLDESDDNQPDQSEYIELRNASESAVSLEGLVLHDEPDENGVVRELVPVSSNAKWVPAGGHVLIYADKTTTFKQSNVANFFDISTPEQRSLMRIDRTTLSLASNDDAIYIADSTGANIDSVFYDESWQNPNLIDTRGIALERISPEGTSNDKTNWGSSVNPKGGTPNSENSIFQPQSEPPAETGISFSPNPFTPDGNGDKDNLFINYTLDQQDYLIKVRIYDRYGRLVKELADGKQAGFSGQLIWDGRKDDGGRNRIGIYIVVFEAFDSASGKDKAFKKPVVLARPLN